MKTTASFQDLSKQIEQVVHDHITASHKAACAALGRAFATSVSAPAKPRRSSDPGPGERSQRRVPAEMAALSERLCQAVCSKPGESMAVLAADVGATPRELNRPMLHLKHAGKIRSVGQRHLTRYFPLASNASESA